MLTIDPRNVSRYGFGVRSERMVWLHANGYITESDMPGVQAENHHRLHTERTKMPAERGGGARCDCVCVLECVQTVACYWCAAHALSQVFAVIHIRIAKAATLKCMRMARNRDFRGIMSPKRMERSPTKYTGWHNTYWLVGLNTF